MTTIHDHDHLSRYDRVEAQRRMTAAASRRRRPGPPDQVARAVDLLLALWETGRRHGIDPDIWDLTTCLPTAVLDVIRAQDRRDRQ